MEYRLKTFPIATVLAAGLLVVPLTAGHLTADSGLFGVSPALAGNGNGTGPGGGNGGSHGGGNGGGHGSGHGHGPAGTFGADKSLKTASKGGKSGTSHGHGFGIAQSFVDSVGKGVGKASSGVQSMFDGVFGRGHSQGKATTTAVTTPEDVPIPTERSGKAHMSHGNIGAFSSLGRADQAYAHSQSPMMVAMRSYIQDYMAVVDEQGVEAAKTDPDLQAELASIVATFGKAGATQTETVTTTDEVTGLATTTSTTTVDPAVADYIDGVLGDGSEGSKMSDIRGMLDDSSSTDSTTTSSTTETSSSTTTDPSSTDPGTTTD